MSDQFPFPVDIDLSRKLLHVLPLHTDVLERSIFLDSRIDASLTQADRIALDQIEFSECGSDDHHGGFLFHTSFCGSTLLARALHLPPWQVSLREPLVLRRFADANVQSQLYPELLSKLTRYFFRPWLDKSAIILKPTHVILPLAAAMLDAAPNKNAIVLTSSLDDFLISNLKKPAETQAKVPELLRRQALGNRFFTPSEQCFKEANFADIVALQWTAQICWIAELQNLYPSRLLIVNATDVYADLCSVAEKAHHWLNLPAPFEAFIKRCDDVSGVHAKAPHLAYDASTRAAHIKMVRQQLQVYIEAAKNRWTERVLPCLSNQARTLAQSLVNG